MDKIFLVVSLMSRDFFQKALNLRSPTQIHSTVSENIKQRYVDKNY